MRYDLDKFKLELPDKMKNIVKERQNKWQFAVRLLNFKVILADFWPKYLEAVSMATERQMSELALKFFVVPRKNHCQQYSIKSETAREQPLL